MSQQTTITYAQATRYERPLSPVDRGTLCIMPSKQQPAELASEVEEPRISHSRADRRKGRHSRVRLQSQTHPKKRTSKPKPRTSWVYNHMPDVNPETRYYDDNGELEWRCKYCPKTYALSGGTAVIMDHLCDPPSEEGHGLERHAARDAQAKNQQTTIQSAMKQAEEYPYKRRREGDSSGGGSINPGVLEIL